MRTFLQTFNVTFSLFFQPDQLGLSPRQERALFLSH